MKPVLVEARADSIVSALDWAGACLVRDFPVDGNGPLVALAEALGEVVPDTRMPTRAMEGPVYRVEEDPENHDEHAYSASAGHFPLHTDCAHFPKTPHVMMLLCVTPSTTGGETLLAHVNDVVAKLTEQERDALVTTEFPWGKKPAPILWKDRGTWCIRYNHATLMREMARENFKASWLVTTSLGKLGTVLRGMETPALRMNAGDLLVVDNHRVLHGRTAFPPGSGRLLKRLRVWLSASSRC